MRAKILTIRLGVALLLCYISFTLFVQTAFYTWLRGLLGTVLPGIDAHMVLLALLTTVVLTACLLGGERASGFVYGLALILYFPSALSLSGINWAAVLGVPLELGGGALFVPTLLVGIAIVASYLLLLSTSQIDGARRELLRRGGAEGEVSAALTGQVAVAGAAISASVFVALSAAFLPGLFPAAFDAPFAYLILGACGAILVLVSVSFYLLAVRGPGPPGEAKAPEAL